MFPLYSFLNYLSIGSYPQGAVDFFLFVCYSASMANHLVPREIRDLYRLTCARLIHFCHRCDNGVIFPGQFYFRTAWPKTRQKKYCIGCSLYLAAETNKKFFLLHKPLRNKKDLNNLCLNILKKNTKRI